MTDTETANFLIYAFDQAANFYEELAPTDYELKEFLKWSGAAEKSTMTAIFKFFVVGMNYALVADKLQQKE